MDGLQAWIEILKVIKAVGKQAAADQQHQGQRDLPDYERLAKPNLVTGSRKCAGFILES